MVDALAYVKAMSNASTSMSDTETPMLFNNKCVIRWQRWPMCFTLQLNNTARPHFHAITFTPTLAIPAFQAPFGSSFLNKAEHCSVKSALYDHVYTGYGAAHYTRNLMPSHLQRVMSMRLINMTLCRWLGMGLALDLIRT